MHTLALKLLNLVIYPLLYLMKQEYIMVVYIEAPFLCSHLGTTVQKSSSHCTCSSGLKKNDLRSFHHVD